MATERPALARRVIIPMFVPIVLLAIGTFGYRIIEGPHWSWLDALYMATITLTTVGYGETRPLSPAGRVFTIVYLLSGVFTIFFVAIELIRTLVSGEIRDILGRSRMERNLASISQHFIVCGYGRMGQFVCREFESQGLRYVVIDRDESKLAGLQRQHGLFVCGDGTSDEVLERAGATRAKALVTVARSDADNLYITMSARLLNSKLFIVARAEDIEAEEKLKRAGANRVVSPYVIGGSRVAQAVLRPTVVDFLDLASFSGASGLKIEEILLQPGCELAGQALSQIRLSDLGLNVVAVKTGNGKMIVSPGADCVLEPNSVLVVLGESEQLRRLESRASATPRS